MEVRAVVLSTLPRWANLRGPAASAAARRLPPAAVAVKLSPHVDLADPGVLVRRCVAVTVAVHPLLDGLLRAAGTGANGSYTVQHKVSGTPAPELVAALAATHPGAWVCERGTDPGTVFGGPLAAALTARGLHAPVGRAPVRLAGQRLQLSRSRSGLRVTPQLPAVTLAGRQVALGDRLLLTPVQAAELVAAARARGLVVLDADAPGRLAELEWLLRRHALALPVPGAPGWARLSTGDLVTATLPSPALAGDAAAALVAAKGDVAVAVDPAVARTAAVAAARPAGRDGLRDWQDQFVSAYLAAGPGAGLVNALPPGSGKTVCTAAAMAERAGQVTGPYRAVALVPVGVRVQWQRELARFFPAARVCTADSATMLPRAAAEFAEAPGPAVLLLTVELAASAPGPLAQVRADDLVVDEATFLRSGTSARTAAAWALRRRADKAMVLSGTPDPGGVDDAGALVAFAAGQPGMFAEFPLSGPHPLVPGVDRLGPWLFRGPDAAAAALPAAAPEPVQVVPGELEQVIDTVARERVAALLAKAAGPGKAGAKPAGRTKKAKAAASPSRSPLVALASELRAWRLGLASPAALIASRYRLAADVRARAGELAGTSGPQAPGVKVAWAAARAAESGGRGEPVLVFSEFPAALADVAALLAAAGVQHGVLTSAVSARKRQGMVDAFTAGQCPVLLVSGTGQLGLNLPAARVVLHLDVPASAATLLQRSARAARLDSAVAEVAVRVPVLAGCGDEALFAQLRAASPVTDLGTLAAALLAGQSRPGRRRAA